MTRPDYECSSDPDPEDLIDEAVGPVLPWESSMIRPVIDNKTVKFAIRSVEKAGVVKKIEKWLGGRNEGAGGVAEIPSVEALLVGLLLAAWDGGGFGFAEVSQILYYRLSPMMRTRLGLTKLPVTCEAMTVAAELVAERFESVVSTMDTAKADMAAADVDEARRRLDLVVNRIIEASVALVPKAVRRRWNGSVGLDATAVPTGIRRAGDSLDIGDPDAGWFAPRPGYSGVYGHQAHVAVMAPDGVTDDQPFPSMII
jgi:hypothetical protein